MRGGYKGKPTTGPGSFNPNNRFNNNNINNRRNFRNNAKPFVPHVPFDFVHAEHAFQRVKPIIPQEDAALNETLFQRSLALTPPQNELKALGNLASKVQACLDGLVTTPGDFDACTLEEVKQVGSFKKDIMLISSSRLNADICVVLKTLPTKEAVQRLASKVFADTSKSSADDSQAFKNLHFNITESGFELVCPAVVSSVDLACQVLVTTQYQNIRRLEPELHLDYKICQHSLASIKHAKWFEDSKAAESMTIRALCRILKDVRQRFEGLMPLNTWIIELLANYAVTNTLNKTKSEPLSQIVAFRRIFQLLSAGFFLPGSAGIIDPCEHSLTRVHTTMSLEQQDSVCFTAQTLLRVLAHGGFRQILGLEGNSSIATSPSVWAGVVIIPSSKAYEHIKEVEQDKLDMGEDAAEETTGTSLAETSNMELN
jgi:interleukin enhancer-binding factor 2